MPKRLQANAVHGLLGDTTKERIPELTKERVAEPRRAISQYQEQHYLQR